MSEKRLPWFPLFAAQMLIETDGMSAEAVGIYMLGLARQWVDGSLPSDPAKLARTLRVTPSKIGKMIELLDRFFPENSSGFRENPWLSQERARIDSVREKRRDAANARHHPGGKAKSERTLEIARDFTRKEKG